MKTIQYDCEICGQPVDPDSRTYAAFPHVHRECLRKNRRAQTATKFRCTLCEEWKPIADKAPGKGFCLPCRRKKGIARHAARTPEEREAYLEYQRSWKARNPDYMKGYSLQKNYGITAEEYDALFEAQGGVCAICGSPPTKRLLDTDHCHATGRIRGLLCSPCNVAVGMVKEDPKIVRALLSYIEGANSR